MARSFLFLGSVSGFLSVALGAFAAHGLKARLSEYHLQVFRTGVEYQFFHAFALLAVGGLLARGVHPWLRASGMAFVAGTVVFSGSLYLLALTKVSRWGAVTPIGGLGFLAGWALLAAAVLKMEL